MPTPSNKPTLIASASDLQIGHMTFSVMRGALLPDRWRGGVLQWTLSLITVPSRVFSIQKRAAGEAAEFSRSRVDLLSVTGAARLECGEPAAEAGELIRWQLGNSFGDFFDFHATASFEHAVAAWTETPALNTSTTALIARRVCIISSPIC
jgi:hypothetical protein